MALPKQPVGLGMKPNLKHEKSLKNELAPSDPAAAGLKLRFAEEKTRILDDFISKTARVRADG
jgi:hypothetical protein